jgi:hypothetical protein
MDDLEFRRRVYADPRLRDPELASVAQGDTARMRFVREVLRFEERLEAALDVPVPEGLADRVLLRRHLAEEQGQDPAAFERRLSAALAVDVPDGLAARILLRQGLAEQRRRQRVWRGTLALAASVLLSVSLVIALWPQSTTLEESVLAHIHHELNKLSEQHDIPESRLRMVAQKNGAEIVGEIGPVRYAGLCPMREHEGAHIILAGEKGPVTVFLMPHERVASARDVADERFTGRIVPVPNGSMAIVGEQGESIPAIEQRLRGALRFTS